MICSKVCKFINRSVEEILPVKSYGSKIIILASIIFFISWFIAVGITTFLNIQKEEQTIRASLKKVLDIRLYLINDKLDLLQDELSSVPINKLLNYIEFYKYIDGVYVFVNGKEYYHEGKRLNINFQRIFGNNYSLYGTKDYLLLKIPKEGMDVFVVIRKAYILPVLSYTKGMISKYKPTFKLVDKLLEYEDLICEYNKINKSNLILTGCVNRDYIRSLTIRSTLENNLLIFAIFFALAFILYWLIFRKIILFPVHYFMDKVKQTEIEGLENVSFDLHKYGNDEFAKLSNLMDNVSKKIVKDQNALKIVINTTTKLGKYADELKSASFFVLNKIKELVKSDTRGILFYSKLDNRILHSFIVPKEKEKEIKKIIEKNKDLIDFIKNQNTNFCVKEEKDLYTVLVKPLNDEIDIILFLNQKENVDPQSIIYIDIILSNMASNLNLTNLAILDPLTQVYNRRKIFEEAKKEIERSKRYKGNFSMLIIDLDNFKKINDTYGHQAGDTVLKQTIDIIKSKLRKFDSIGRYGGEEFLIILPETDLESAKKVAEKIRKAICSHEYDIGDTILHVTASIGVSSLGYHGETFEDLLKAADFSLYRAKETGKNKIVSLSKDEIINLLLQSIRTKESIEKLISIENLIPYFQGIYEAINPKNLIGYEVLARAKENNRIIEAKDFIKEANKIGKLEEIEKIICMKALEKISYIRDIKKKLFINLSVVNLNINNLFNIIDNYNIPYNNLVIEIPEKEFYEYRDKIKHFITLFKQKGLEVAIDNFGSHFASFELFTFFKIDYLKLDKSLIRDLDKKEDNQILIKSILLICQEKGIKTVAQCIEKREELEIVQKLGVDYVQGYYLENPRPEIS